MTRWFKRGQPEFNRLVAKGMPWTKDRCQADFCTASGKSFVLGAAFWERRYCKRHSVGMQVRFPPGKVFHPELCLPRKTVEKIFAPAFRRFRMTALLYRAKNKKRFAPVIWHMVGRINAKQQVSPLCADKIKPVNLNRARWTTLESIVGCKRCKKRMLKLNKDPVPKKLM